MVRSKGADVDSKRALDLVVGSFALAVSVPILLGVSIGMRFAGDHGPFLYRAQRVGEGGRRITVLKVRTMTEGSRGSGLTTRGDPRVTRLGRLLRRYRIDELPQLVNVLRGEMSLVGPRPEDPRFVDLSDPFQRRVFMAKPGITGLAQLRYRDEALLLAGPDFERRYREEILPAKLLLDAEYLEKRSMWVDLRILVQTIGAVLG
jgi:lipopolysaccharide/colanic/teichoic acid biosynthesis glycosyltransferase